MILKVAASSFLKTSFPSKAVFGGRKEWGIEKREKLQMKKRRDFFYGRGVF